MLQNPAIIAALVGISLTAFILLRGRRPTSNLPLPPSPKGLPLIGHLHLMPPSRPWLYFRKLSQELNSPIVYLNLAGQDTIVLNDYPTAVELLDKRSGEYSSRPRLVVAMEYGSTNKRILLLPYGEEWRRHRAAIHRDMTPKMSLSYLPMQVAETKVLMGKMLKDPKQFMPNFRSYSANIVLKIAYGLKSDVEREQWTSKVYNVLHLFLASAYPGTYLVDTFPILDKLPDFLAPWRRAAMEQRAITQDTFHGLLKDVKHKVARGELAADSTFTSRVLRDMDKFQLDELDIAHLSGTMFEAGTDTTAAALATFVLASITYPATFEAAKAEVDRVCGGHAPTHDDIEGLQYIKAACKETLRWRTVTAGGLPHKASTDVDDEFMGYRIPAGATVLPNFWAMCFDEKTYGQKYDTEVFEPRRWIERPEGVGDIDAGHPAFGFGRRICVGKHLAGNSLFLAIASLCYYFDVKAKPGVTVDTFAYTKGFNIEPEPFECVITPRRGRETDIEHEMEAGLEALRSM